VRYSSSSRNNRGSPGGGAGKLGFGLRELGGEPPLALLELLARVVGREAEHGRCRRDELGVLVAGRPQHLAQPHPRDLAPGVRDRVDDPIGIALAPNRLGDLDQPEPHEHPWRRSARRSRAPFQNWPSIRLSIVSAPFQNWPSIRLSIVSAPFQNGRRSACRS